MGRYRFSLWYGLFIGLLIGYDFESEMIIIHIPFIHICICIGKGDDISGTRLWRQ